MVCEQARMLNEAVADELRERGALLPPWLRYPELERYSIGWRMGYGEWYLIVLRHGTADWSRDEWLTYLRRHAPVPVEWYDWAGWQVGLDVEEAPDDFDLEAELAALGLAAPPPPPG